MAEYNLQTLLHRPTVWKIKLPDGTFKSGENIADKQIRIPKIQRDYAEGRATGLIERKRRSLIGDMIDVLYGTRGRLSFDFVYGDDRDGAFEPLDGQQRITTLFLAYWLFGRESDLRDKDGHSLLIYETRDTSEDFFHWLVNQNAEAIITGWQNCADEIRNQNASDNARRKLPSLFDYMQLLDTFRWDWHDDPNIRSMITVLESTIGCLDERGLKYSEGINNSANLDNITFLLLDNLVCDGDRLFEKMNARGKALTSFEILKSSLEEEMELQGIPASNPALMNGWRNAIDGDWVDYCWDNSNIGDNPPLKDVKGVERRLERLLVRIAGTSFYATDIVSSPMKTPDAVNYAVRLTDSISKRECVNNVIDRYLEYAGYERSAGNAGLTRMDFQCIYDDISNLLFKDGTGQWRDASSLLPQLNRSNGNTLLEEFMADSPTYNVRVMMYAMLSYLRIVPSRSIVGNATEEANFIDWMRFIRNVYNSDNKNSGLDNFDDVRTAVKAIDQWLLEFKANNE